jgi:hypothetical protein
MQYCIFALTPFFFYFLLMLFCVDFGKAVIYHSIIAILQGLDRNDLETRRKIAS